VNVGAGLELHEAVQRYAARDGGAVYGLYVPFAFVKKFVPEAMALLIERDRGWGGGGSAHGTSFAEGDIRKVNED
jgi:hypothetical protein